MSAKEVCANFALVMGDLDAIIYKLETNLGQNHSVSQFVEIKNKYGVSDAQKAPAAAPAKAAAAEGGDAAKPKQEKKAKKEKAPKAPAAAASDIKDYGPELNAFAVSDLRVGKIVECEICPNSEKLYIEKIDLGEGELREIGSGLRQFVPMEEMLREGSLCVVYANLKPRKLAHIMSQGMVMCASNADHTAIEVVRPPAGSKIGERVTLENCPITEFNQEW